MNKRVVFLCILYIFIQGCSTVKKFDSIADTKHILFDKVRLEFKHQLIRVKAKGFVKVDTDSLVSFKFWGPLGFELVKGEYSNSLSIYNYVENTERQHVESELFKKFGLIINRKSIEYFLMGDGYHLLNELKKLNQYNSQLVFQQQKDVIIIKNERNAEFIELRYKMRGNIPFQINLTLTDKEGSSRIAIEYISINAARLK